MCGIKKQNQMNKQNQKQKHTHRGRQQIDGYQRESGVEEGKTGKGVNCTVTDGDQAFGCKHNVIYTDVELQCCTSETYKPTSSQ